MRTKTILLSAAVITAGLLSSSAQSNVYSVNIVGYVNTPLTAGAALKYTLVANPLNNDVSNAYSNLFNVLPANSQVLKWTGSAYSTATRTSFGTGWSPAGAENTTLSPGEGAFIRLPAGAAPVTNTFVGQFAGAGSYTNPLPTGYTLKGSIVPVAGTSTALGIDAALPGTPSGSQLLKWDSVNQTYLTFNRLSFGSGWSPSCRRLA